MQTITSAYANKMLKSLEEDKAFWVNKEAASSTYVAAINEEPVIPEYDYSEVASMITAKMCIRDSHGFTKEEQQVKDTWVDYVLQGNAVLAEPEQYITLRE